MLNASKMLKKLGSGGMEKAMYESDVEVLTRLGYVVITTVTVKKRILFVT